MPITEQNHIPNEQQLIRTYGGTEAVLGTLVPPTFRLYGTMALTRTRALADRNEYNGTRFKDFTPVRGPVVVDGTYAQALTYEDGPILSRYAMAGGNAGVTDGATTPGYTYVKKPSPDVFDIDFMSGEYGFPGLGPFTYTGLHFPEFTISGDIDNAEACWQWNARALALTKDMKAAIAGAATSGSTSTITKIAAGWTVNAFAGAYVTMKTGTAGNIGQVRKILSNTATDLTVVGVFPAAVAAADTFEIHGIFTAGIADRTRETIDFPGTLLYLDNQTAIGTTLVPGRFISFSITFNSNSAGKRFAENVTGYSRFGFGAFVVTGQVRLEFDGRAEYDKWIAGSYTAIRIKQLGSIIDVATSTRKLAQIDIYATQWDAFPMDARGENVTVTATFRGYVDPTETIPGGLTWKNKLATLP